MNSPRPQPLLVARKITKAFGPVTVLQDVGFDLQPGEVHSLVGENGAGKSTLLKIIAGVHQAVAGEILLDNEPVAITDPRDAQRHGIALIHQEPLIFPDLDVAENIFVAHREKSPLFSLVKWRRRYQKARELLDSLGVHLDPRAKVFGLSIADRQMVEMAGALSQKARILLMDEPTASLTPDEVKRLFQIVRRLRDSGAAIVFISHRLEEVFALSDRITVLRDGQWVATRSRAATTVDEVIRMMVGRPLSALYEKVPSEPGRPLLEVSGLGRPGRFRNVDLDIRAGEIVGLAGLVGAGRTDIARALFGIAPAMHGEIRVDGRKVTIESPADAIGLGLALVPEDRQEHGLFSPLSIAQNASAASLQKVFPGKWIRPEKEAAVAETYRTRLNIASRDVGQPASELSGGNQQKVVLAKWLHTEPEILILDEPTRGVDIGAKQEVHHLMSELSRQGKAILLISSDLPEILAMSDRILVLREGKVMAQFSRQEATSEKIMAAATGQKEGAESPSGPPAPPAGKTIAKRLLRFRELGILSFTAVLIGVAAYFEPRFVEAENLRNILRYIPLIVVVAMGQMMVIISRNIDLSVGSTLGFSAIVVGNLFIQFPDFPLWAAAAVSVLIGAGLGALNGALVAWFNIPAIIATLGTLSIYRGMIFLYSGGRQVDPHHIPTELIRLSQTSPIGIPWLVIFAAAIALATFLGLRYVGAGREIYAIGSNPAAAALRGIGVRGNTFLVFTLCGALAGAAGLMFASRFGYVNPSDTGVGFELVVISAVIIGGTNVFGGSGTVLGALTGCLLLGVIYVGLAVLGISGFWQLAIYGFAILLAVTFDTIVQRQLGKARDGSEML